MANLVVRAQKTYAAMPHKVERNWYLIDAENLVLGRVASFIAPRLRGKDKPIFSPHVDCGDHIVVVNASRIALTGRKWDAPRYRHTGYPGGIKTRRARDIPADRLIKEAVYGMLPRGPLARRIIKKLHVYSGPDHPHQAQNPSFIDVAGYNRKNSIEGGMAKNQNSIKDDIRELFRTEMLPEIKNNLHETVRDEIIPAFSKELDDKLSALHKDITDLTARVSSVEDAIRSTTTEQTKSFEDTIRSTTSEQTKALTDAIRSLKNEGPAPK